jgi:hypothetical protein
MWELPSRADFAPDDGILGGIGKLHHTFFGGMQRYSAVILERAALPEFTSPVLVSELVTTLKLLLYHLEFISTTFRTMQIVVRETQRVCLELRALLDFEEIFRPRMAQSISMTSVNPDIMGAFTNDLGVCDTLFRAGIPVWLVRPSSALHSIRVRARAPLLVATDTIPLDRPSGPPHPFHRTIYVGAGNKLEKYIAIAQYVRQLLRFPDPFGSVRAKPLVAPPPLAQPSNHGTGSSSRRFTPCNAFFFVQLFSRLILVADANRPHRGVKDPRTPSGGRNKFEDPESTLYPPAIPAWRRAAEGFDVQSANFVYELIPTDLGYIFPEPAAFVAVTPERQEALFHGWLKYRNAMIYRVSSSDFTAQPMPQGLWRDFLTLEHVQKKRKLQQDGDSPRNIKNKTKKWNSRGSAVQSSESTRSSKHREQAADFLKGCLNAAEGIELIDSNGELKWNGKVITSLNDLEREEILWELAELNFRFELLALDSRATSAPSVFSRQELIRDCFPGTKGGDGALLVADLGAANHGLASENWEEKALYMQALRKIMMTWRGDVPPIILAEKFQWTNREIEDLEDAIAVFYVRSFYNHFRRAPVVPRGLSHQALPYRAPLPPTITVQDPAPNIFYDISVLHPMPKVS